MKQFDRETNNLSKTSHTLANLENMMLLPKQAKQREFDPCSIGLFQFQTPIRRKLEESEKHKRRILSNKVWTSFWDFPQISFFLLIFLWAEPLMLEVVVIPTDCPMP